jgi:hypothetical protein
MRIPMRWIAPVAIALITLTGCTKETPKVPADNGVAAMSGEEILTKAQDALAAAKSFRLRGNVDLDEGGKLALDVKVRGQDLTGTFTMSGGTGPKGTAEAIRVNGETFFKGDSAFWKSVGGSRGAAAVELFEGKWVKPTDDDKYFGALLKLTDPETLLKADGPVTKGETKKIGDFDTITLKDGESALYVATKGEPYPIRIEGPPGQGQVDFSDFGAAFDEIVAPPAEQVVDMSKLK